jgi:hypothetical protein
MRLNGERVNRYKFRIVTVLVYIFIFPLLKIIQFKRTGKLWQKNPSVAVQTPAKESGSDS